MKTGVRVFISESSDPKTAAKSYYAAVWLPGAEHPVMTDTFASRATRQRKIRECIKFHLGTPPPATKSPQEVQVPHTDGQPAIEVFKLASGSRRDA